MNLYRDVIQKMQRIQLLEIAEKYGLKIDDTDSIDADETIELLENEQGTIFESVEDDILDSIKNGNWTDAAKQMIKDCITPHALIDYINDYRYEQYEEAYDWFDLESAVSITELYHELRR